MPRHHKHGRPPLQGSAKPIPGKCASRLRRSIEKWGHWRYCKRGRVEGRDRCGKHGGKSPRGLASATYVHGKRSEFERRLPAKLAATYHEERTAPDLLSLEKDIRLLEALQVEELKAMRVGDVEALLREGRHQTGVLLTAIDAPDIGALRDAAKRLEALFEGQFGSAADAVDRIRSLSQEKRMLVQAQLRLHEFVYTAMTAEQVMGLFRTLSNIVVEEVKDLDALGRIQERFLVVTGRVQEAGEA